MPLFLAKIFFWSPPLVLPQGKSNYGDDFMAFMPDEFYPQYIVFIIDCHTLYGV